MCCQVIDWIFQTQMHADRRGWIVDLVRGEECDRICYIKVFLATFPRINQLGHPKDEIHAFAYRSHLHRVLNPKFELAHQKQNNENPQASAEANAFRAN
jgi:hypothetical protein